MPGLEDIPHIDERLAKVENIVNTPTASDKSSGSGAPTTTPTAIGQVYIDKTTGNIYIASDTKGPYNWAFVGRGATDAFTKDTVPGIILWYDATKGVTVSGSSVTGWDDQSGSGHTLTQVTSADMPLLVPSIQNGLPGVLFNGSTDHIDKDPLGSSYAQPFTIFAVVNQVSTTDATPKIFSSDTNTTSLYYSAAKVPSIYCGAAVDAPTQSYNVTYLITALGKDNDGWITVNAGTQSTGDTGANTIVSQFCLGGYATVNNFNGYIFEFIAYSGELADSDISIIQTYLNNKWAIY